VKCVAVIQLNPGKAGRQKAMTEAINRPAAITSSQSSFCHQWGDGWEVVPEFPLL
jgi:hypothetical protein